MSRQAISKTVRELETIGLLRQERDIEQANSMVLVLTPDGQSCIDQVEIMVQELQSRLSEKFGEEAMHHTLTVLSADWEAILKE